MSSVPRHGTYDGGTALYLFSVAPGKKKRMPVLGEDDGYSSRMLQEHKGTQEP